MTSSEPQTFQGFYPLPEAGGAVWRWVTVGDIRFEHGRGGSGFVDTIEGGWPTDMASIPRWLAWLVNPFDPQTARAAAIHDWMLAKGYEQRVAAGEFYRQLALDNVRLRKRIAYYLAVLVASTKW